MTDWRHLRTGRLWLDQPEDEDADALLAIHADPASWWHFPSGLVTDPAAGRTMVGASRRRFARDGLAYWSVRDEDSGPVVGRGGCVVPDEALGGRGWWNLYYRLDQRVLGRGYATEMGEAAIRAARAVAPDRPVLAFLLEHTPRRGARPRSSGCGSSGVGRTTGTPTPRRSGWSFLDRDPDDVFVAEVATQGWGPDGFVA